MILAFTRLVAEGARADLLRGDVKNGGGSNANINLFGKEVST